MGRKYSNISRTMSLTATVGVSDTVITVDDPSGLPITFPYNLALEIDTSNIEIVLVTAATGDDLTITRGREDTPARAHSTGATATHVATALDFQEAVSHIEGTTNVHGVGGGNAVVGTGTTQTLTNKTISGANNTITDIDGDALQPPVTLENVLIDNDFAPGSAALIVETQLASTAATQLNRVRNGAIGLEMIPGDASPTTFDFVNFQNPASNVKFRVTQAGNVTNEGTLGVTGATTLTGNLTVNGNLTTTKNLDVTQGNSAVNGLKFTPHATPGPDPYYVIARASFDGIAIEKDTSSNSGNFIQCRQNGGSALIDLKRDGTIEAADFTISGSPDRSVKTELDVAKSIFVRKTADETVNNSTTQQDDNHLFASVVANATYMVEVHLIANIFFTAGLASSFTYPAAAEINGYVLGPAADGSGVGSNNGFWYTVWNQAVLADTSSPSSTLATGGLSAGTAWDVPHIFRGYLITGANAGTLQFRWAQATAVANNTIVRTGSWMELRRVA